MTRTDGFTPFLVAALLMCGGCKHDQPAAVTSNHIPVMASTAPQLTDAEKIARLNARAKPMGLRWKVICIPDEKGGVENYLGYAEQKTSPEGAIYYEDGRRDWWSASGNSPIEAADNLYEALAEGPNQTISHDPGKPKRGKCNYNTVLSSNSKTVRPCEDQP